MRERPIILSAWEVRAILEGRKTQTRRVCKPQPDAVLYRDQRPMIGFDGKPLDFAELACPFGLPGTKLWVRENAWIANQHDFDPHVGNRTDDQGHKRVIDWDATMDGDARRCAKEYGVKLTPSIHMPRWASRILLEVTEVRVQRLREISEEDAKAEGAERMEALLSDDSYGNFYVVGFHSIWEGINAARGYGWDSDPFVWAVSFRVLTTTGEVTQ